MKGVRNAVLGLAVLALPVAAQPVKNEDQIKLRRAAYALMGFNFASLAAMAQEKKPFSKEEAMRNADFVATLATVPKAFFGEGTDKGETKARAEIWAKRSDFDAKMDRMNTEAAKLPQAVRSGDMAAFRKQVADTGAACKACHDDYRNK